MYVFLNYVRSGRYFFVWFTSLKDSLGRLVFSQELKRITNKNMINLMKVYREKDQVKWDKINKKVLTTIFAN